MKTNSYFILAENSNNQTIQQTERIETKPQENDLQEEIDNYYIINLVRKIQRNFRFYLFKLKNKQLIGMNNENLNFSFISNYYNSTNLNKSKIDFRNQTIGNLIPRGGETKDSFFSKKKSKIDSRHNTLITQEKIKTESNIDEINLYSIFDPISSIKNDNKLLFKSKINEKIDNISDFLNYSNNNYKFYGCKINDNKIGFGIVIWENSDDKKKGSTKLIGNFINNKLNGFSIFERFNGSLFQGELKNNIAEGFGIYQNISNTFYSGEWKNDKQSGYGSEYWSDGSFYEGEFKNGLKEGVGTYRWNDGSIYEGEWCSNLMQGYGIYLSSDEKVYKGEFLNSMMNGFGILKIKNEKIYYGNFIKDKKEGFGIFIWTSPFKAYIGFWKNSKQHGVGKYIYEKNSNLSTVGTLETDFEGRKFSSKYGLWIEGERMKWFKNYEEAKENFDGNQIILANKFKVDGKTILNKLNEF